MAVARVQHTYNHKTGLPVDAVVNTFYFSSGTSAPALNATQAAALQNAVLAFYDNVATGQPLSLRTFTAEASMASNRHTVKVYDMGDLEPRVPLTTLTTAFGNANNANAPMPAEVTCCLSFRAPIVSGQKMNRRRGRIFHGPLVLSAGAVDANGHFRPTAGYRDSLVAAGRGLQVAAIAAGYTWVVRHGGVAEVGGGTLPSVATIEHCWADDAFDTQRRRGPKPTTRSTLTF